MPPKRREGRSRIADEMRLRMIHNRSHGPHHHTPADACSARVPGPGATGARRTRLSQAVRSMGRSGRVPPTP
jgi:hypothetical protein